MIRRLLVLSFLWLCAACTDASASAPSAKESAPGWDLTRAQRWSVELTSRTSLAGVPAPMSFVLKAELTASFRQQGGHEEALLRLLEPKLLDGAGKPLEGADAALVELAKPFVASFQDGQLSGYRDAPGSSTLTIGLERALAALLQRKLPSGGKALRSTEWDATGRASVEYRELRDGGYGYRKLAYETVNMAMPQQRAGVKVTRQLPEVVRSEGRFQVDAKGLVSLERSELIRLPLSADSQLSSTTEARLARLGLAPVAASDEWEAALSSAVARRVDEPIPQDSRGSEVAKVGDRTLAQIVAELRALDAQGEEAAYAAQKRGPLFHALVGSFRLHPEAPAEALALVRAEKSESLRDTLLDALSMASTVESVRALESIAFDAKVDEKLRRRAASSLIRTGQPGPEAMAVAERMIGLPELWEHGVLGLGTFVRLVRERGVNELAEQGTRLLDGQLKKASDAAHRKVVLLAIANSGSDALFDAARTYQHDQDVGVRDAAIQAVRLMNHGEVEATLAAFLAPKAAKADVLSALHALRKRAVRQESTVRAVEHLAREHAMADVRREAVLALVAWEKDWPAAAEVIRDRNANDADPHVRAVAVPLSSPTGAKAPPG